jgi:hypothetical protein
MSAMTVDGGANHHRQERTRGEGGLVRDEGTDGGARLAAVKSEREAGAGLAAMMGRGGNAQNRPTGFARLDHVGSYPVSRKRNRERFWYVRGQRRTRGRFG